MNNTYEKMIVILQCDFLLKKKLQKYFFMFNFLINFVK
jgi:hypothetical protein